MNRREIITLLGSAAAWSVAARAQQPMPVIGFLATGSADSNGPTLAAFRQGLMETGYVEGQNVAIEYRWGDEVYDRLPALAADLVRRQVKVIATAGGNLPAIAAKALSTSIPIVFTTGNDPVAAGLVASFNRPGGNLTGAVFLSTELGPKRLELLHELVPTATICAVLLNPNNPTFENRAGEFEAAARALGMQLHVLRISTDHDIEALPSTIAHLQIGALLIGPDNFIFSRNAQIAALALSHRVPAMYQWRKFADSGGLISYGPSEWVVYHQSGIYTGRILRGDKPADLPIVQSTKIELVINLKTAKALGLTVPPSLLVAADEVIE